MYTTAINTISR